MNVSLLIYVFVIFDGYLHEIFNSAFCIIEPNNEKNVPRTVWRIQKFGYPAEVHTVETEDGYLLQMHRIPNGEANKVVFFRNGTAKRKFPVLLQHGLMGSSADFVLLEPSQSLAFTLADLGYDVWLGNLRGNVYSKAHSTLSVKDYRFWNFSWHESGIYDLPAQIDYICQKTNSEKVFFVGYSMGTTAFFVMTSTRLEYNDKIAKAFLLAPVAHLRHANSPTIKNFLPIADVIKFVIDRLSYGELGIKPIFLKNLGRIFGFFNKIEKVLCKFVAFLFSGFNMAKYDKETLSVYNEHYPAGYSVKGVYHYAQLAKSGEFRHYDYGPEGNGILYGTPIPPNYNLQAIRAKMYFFLAYKDNLSFMLDAIRLSKQLKTLKKMYVVDEPNFNHLDFILGEKVKELVYEQIIALMDRYEESENTFNIWRKKTQPEIHNIVKFRSFMFL